MKSLIFLHKTQHGFCGPKPIIYCLTQKLCKEIIKNKHTVLKKNYYNAAKHVNWSQFSTEKCNLYNIINCFFNLRNNITANVIKNQFKIIENNYILPTYMKEIIKHLEKLSGNNVLYFLESIKLCCVSNNLSFLKHCTYKKCKNTLKKTQMGQI